MQIIRKSYQDLKLDDKIISSINGLQAMLKAGASAKFIDELLKLYQDGTLSRWLRCHNGGDEADKLDKLILSGNKVYDLCEICCCLCNGIRVKEIYDNYIATLEIDGSKVQDIKVLVKHPSDLFCLYQKGTLSHWLRWHDGEEAADRLDKLTLSGNKLEDIYAICYCLSNDIKKKDIYDKVIGALELDGEEIEDMEELAEHPSTELLDLYQEGTLSHWLRWHDGEDAADRLDSLTPSGDKAKDLHAVFLAVGIDFTLEDTIDCIERANLPEQVKLDNHYFTTLSSFLHTLKFYLTAKFLDDLLGLYQQRILSRWLRFLDRDDKANKLDNLTLSGNKVENLYAICYCLSNDIRKEDIIETLVEAPVIAGKKINNINELVEHPSAELVDLYQKGTLSRWLRWHNGEDEANKLDNLNLSGDKLEDLYRIFCCLSDDIKKSDIYDGIIGQLNIDGKPIYRIPCLLEHPTAKLLDIYQEGTLSRWLRWHDGENEADKLDKLTLSGDKLEDLYRIYCCLSDDIKKSDIYDGVIGQLNNDGNIKIINSVVSMLQHSSTKLDFYQEGALSHWLRWQSSELLDLYQKGSLSHWLRWHNGEDKAAKLDKLTLSGNKVDALYDICCCLSDDIKKSDIYDGVVGQLEIDGIKINSVVTMLEHPSTKLLDLCQEGTLSHWLRWHDGEKEADKLDMLTLSGDKLEDLYRIYCCLSDDIQKSDIYDGVVGQLEIDGIKINSVADMLQHPSTELLDLYQEGTLSHWLRWHDGEKEADKLDKLTLSGDKARDLYAVCLAVGIDITLHDIIDAIRGDMENIIIDHFTPYYNIEDSSNVYLKGKANKIGRDTIQKAIDAFAYGISVEDVILFIDKTFFKADEGMIMTCNKIYYKNDDKKGHGVINIMELERVYAERKLLANSFELKDTSGRYYQLGQLASLKDQLYKLEDCMEKFIETIKNLRKG